MGLSIADAASLVTKGYKVSELKEVGKLIDQNPSESNNIIELAKKLGFSEFNSAMQLFVKPDDKKSEDHDEDETDEGADDQGENQNNEDSSADDQAGTDDVDYKKLYEESKQELEKVKSDLKKAQKDNTKENMDDPNKKSTDEVLQDIVRSFM